MDFTSTISIPLSAMVVLITLQTHSSFFCKNGVVLNESENGGIGCLTSQDEMGEGGGSTSFINVLTLMGMWMVLGGVGVRLLFAFDMLGNS